MHITEAALDALESDCWDNIDERGDGTLICYPADSRMDPRTGAYEQTQVIVKARRPEWTTRLVDCYRARNLESLPYGIR